MLFVGDFNVFRWLPSTVLKCYPVSLSAKKAAMCLTEKIREPNNLHSGVSYRAVGRVQC